MSNFPNTLSTLLEHRPPQAGEANMRLFRALLYDLGDVEDEEWLEDDPSLELRRLKLDQRPELIAPLKDLSWFEDATFSLLYTDRQRERTTLGTPYDVVWFSVQLSSEVTPGVPASRLVDLRAAIVDTLIGEQTQRLQRLRRDLVLFVTVCGPGYAAPELYVTGPRPEVGDGGGGSPPRSVCVKRLPFHKAARTTNPKEAHDRLLLMIAPLDVSSQRGWREAFDHDFDTLTKVRDHFRREMRGALLELMTLLEQTRGHIATTPEELRQLREAATLLIYRLMFLLEVERRGLLYQATERGRYALTELMEIDDEERRARPGAILDRVRALTRAVRDGSSSEVAIAGASIFSDRPNVGFGERELADWLEPLDQLDLDDADSDTLQRWDKALRTAGAVATGQLNKEVQLSNERLGAGGAAHTHRVLGDVYEQILAMVPARKKARKDQTHGDLQLKLRAGKKDERSALGAHYTPPELVDEVVRPALGHLFAQTWEGCGQDPDAYAERVARLRVCDPAMGSAHFLTVAALEIARELAWVELNGAPRDFTWHEPTLHPNPIGPNPDGFDPDKRDDDSDFAPTVDHLYGGDGAPDDFDEAVQRHLPGVVQRCIYGVDVNPLACELSKLSLWLFTLAVQTERRPELTFLDGNITCGNSLVGLSFQEAEAIILDRLGATLTIGNLDLLTKGDSILTLWTDIDHTHGIMRSPAAELRDKADGQPLVVAGLSTRTAPVALIRKRFYDHSVRLLNRARWIYDLALLAEFYGYSSRSAASRKKLLKVLNQHGADLKPADVSSKSTFWQRLADAALPSQDRTDQIRAAIVAAAAHLPLANDLTHRVLHWELAFPSIFPPVADAPRGFDAVVANPPFVGDRKLRAHIGDAMINYLKDAYLDGAVSDLCGFFFRRFDALVNPSGVASSLAPNTLAQAKNRREAMAPLVTGDPPPFQIVRARKSETWPGDANVYICMSLFARSALSDQRFMRFDAQQWLADVEHLPISSYLDLYPEMDFATLPSMNDGVCYQGHITRGEYFIHNAPTETLQQALDKIPTHERSSLGTYLNNQELMQQPRPEPSRIAINFFDTIVEAGLENAPASKQLSWLEANRPVLLKQLKEVAPGSEQSVRDTRLELEDNQKNAPHREFWWLFAYPRINLKKRSEALEQVVAFGAVSKVWSPSHLPMRETTTGLRICPSHAVFISPVQEKAFFATLTSFLFEAHMRREASTLKGDVRVTPTDSLPVFPLPWKPVWDEAEGRPFITEVPRRTEARLGGVVDRLLAHRQAMLDKPLEHEVPEGELTSQWGPTKLYNLYDDPTQTFEAVVTLRALHEELLEAVLREYGWGDLLEGLSWEFDTPWIDRTTRYVPDLETRRALFDRLAELNAERYRYEIKLYLPHIIATLEPGVWTSLSRIKDAVREAGIVISDPDLDAALAQGVSNRKHDALERDPSGRYPRWRRPVE